MGLPSNFVEKYGPWTLVTGASAGIGAEFASQLAEAGLNVVLVARREALLNDHAASLREKYAVQTRCIAADLTSDGGCDLVVTTCEDIEIGLLVNNAGIGVYGSFFRETIASHSKLIDLNCKALVSLSHSFGRMMIDRKKGGVILISSVLSSPTPYYATYSASKSFVSCFGRILREELKKYEVNTTVIEPGVIDTEASRARRNELDYERGGFSAMSPQQCVAESLAAFASGRALYIPGVKNKVSTTIMRTIPADLSMKLGNSLIDQMMDPEAMKPL